MALRMHCNLRSPDSTPDQFHFNYDAMPNFKSLNRFTAIVRVQLFVSTCNGRPHLSLQHHWLLSINCHFDDCKARLVRFPCKTRYIRIPGFSLLAWSHSEQTQRDVSANDITSSMLPELAMAVRLPDVSGKCGSILFSCSSHDTLNDMRI